MSRICLEMNGGWMAIGNDWSLPVHHKSICDLWDCITNDAANDYFCDAMDAIVHSALIGTFQISLRIASNSVCYFSRELTKSFLSWLGGWGWQMFGLEFFNLIYCSPFYLENCSFGFLARLFSLTWHPIHLTPSSAWSSQTMGGGWGRC